MAWLAMGLHAGLVAATVLSYVHRGAIPFGRYFFPALPLLPVVAAAGLAALPGARRGLPTLVALLVATGIGLAMTGVVLATMNQRSGAAPASLIGRLTGALAAAGIRGPGLALIALAGLLTAGLWLLTTSGTAALRSRPNCLHPQAPAHLPVPQPARSPSRHQVRRPRRR